jgi:inhibitor-of-growth protein 1
MQNVAAVEALYSATFMEDYLDCVENLPNDLQRHLSRLREFDLTQYTEFLRDLGSLVSAFEKETTASGQRSILAKIQHGLIAAQDIGDDKLATVQVKFYLFGRYLLKFNIIIQRYVSLVCLSL